MEKKRDSFFLQNKKKDKNAGQEKKEEFNNKRQEQFSKSRGIEKEDAQKSNGDKKPFDKKAYRLKKYSKRYKLEQWEEQRKKKLLREFHKDIKDDAVAGSYKPKSFDEDATDGDMVGKYVRHPDLIENENESKKTKFVKKDPFHKAKEHLNKIKEEKLQKQQEIQKAKEEKRLKIQEYKKKKQERFKKLSKKTKKGQPVMTGRLELLLEKIQKG